MPTAANAVRTGFRDPDFNHLGQCSIPEMCGSLRGCQGTGYHAGVLPPYSPHLNLIEQLWCFVRKECLYSKYYADFASFKTAISDVINTENPNAKKWLKSIMILKFQSFKKVQFFAE